MKSLITLDYPLALTLGCVPSTYTLNRFLSEYFSLFEPVCVHEPLEAALLAVVLSTMLSTWLVSNICLMNGWMDEWMNGPRGLNVFLPLSLRIALPSLPYSVFLPKLSWKTSRKVRLMPRVAEKLAKAGFSRIVLLAHLAPTNIPTPQANGSTFGNRFLFSTDFLQFKAAFPEIWCFQCRNLYTPTFHFCKFKN